MSNYLTNTLPVDRLAKCFFAETFISTADMVENGATIYGTPDVRFGADFNGTTDYFIYDSTGWFVDKDPWSCVVEFYPKFLTSEDSDRRIFATNAGNYSIWKRNNANSNTLLIALGGTVIAQIAEATYSPLWVINKKNLITVSGTSGATDVWMNGTQILTADVSAWTPTNDSQVAIGSNVGGTNNFYGRITMLKFYNTLLTESDHRYYYGQG